MDKEKIIQKTVQFVQDETIRADGAHDWWHTYRVWQVARRIATEESANIFVVELSALLHDVADEKLNNGSEEIGQKKVQNFLKSLIISAREIDWVMNVIMQVSFRETFAKKQKKSKELAVVQDADRLDAIGAIGIARAFSFGGHKNRVIYDPHIQPITDMTREEYIKRESPTINHFYEKLLLLKNRMHTETGKRLATERHRFMERYLEEFYAEWEGKK